MDVFKIVFLYLFLNIYNKNLHAYFVFEQEGFVPIF